MKRSIEEDVMLLNDAFDYFLDEKEAMNLSEATLRSYEDSFIKFCNFYGYDDEATTDAITQQDIFKWINTMKHDGLAISSINHYLRDIRAFFYWCMDSDRQYIQQFKISTLSKQEEPPKLFTDGELELLLDKPRVKDGFSEWRSWAIVNWVLGAGSRASTICNVKICDVDFKKKEIVYAHTKNKKSQTVPLSSSLATVLKEYIRMWHGKSTPEQYLFCNIGLEQLTTNALRQAFTKYCADRGVSRHNIHGLRHNFAKGWIKNNGDMFKLQQILGHATLEMTRRYVRLFSEDIKEDYDKFNPLDVIKRKQKRTHNVRRYEY